MNRCYLKGYLELKGDGSYVPTGRFREHPKTLERISSRLQEWAYTTQQCIHQSDSGAVECDGWGSDDDYTRKMMICQPLIRGPSRADSGRWV